MCQDIQKLQCVKAKPCISQATVATIWESRKQMFVFTCPGQGLRVARRKSHAVWEGSSVEVIGPRRKITGRAGRAAHDSFSLSVFRAYAQGIVSELVCCHVPRNLAKRNATWTNFVAAAIRPGVREIHP